MAKDLPYLPTYKNVGLLFDKIEKAKVPDAFTTSFLMDTIGLKGSGDRQLIGLLKKLGFLDNAGKPTSDYNLLKNKQAAKGAIANAVKKAYGPLYAANEDAHHLPNDQLKGLIAQVSGAEEGINKLITGTFNALLKVADFTAAESEGDGDEGNAGGDGQDTPPPALSVKGENPNPPAGAKFAPSFRFNIEIHLPSNGTEDTYLAIFNALRKSLG